MADGADLDSVVTVMEAAAPREVAGYTFESERAVEADGVPAVLWTGSFPSPVGDGRLVESHLVTDPASTNGVIVHLLATTPSDTPDDVLDAIGAAMSDVALGTTPEEEA